MLKLLWILLFSCSFAGAFAQMNMEENRATLVNRSFSTVNKLRIHGFAGKEGGEMRFELSRDGQSFRDLKATFVGEVDGKQRWTFKDPWGQTAYLESIGFMSMKYTENEPDGKKNESFYGLEAKMENNGDILYVIFADVETYFHWQPKDPNELAGAMTIHDRATFQANIRSRENMHAPIKVSKMLEFDKPVTVRFLPPTEEEQKSGSRRLEWKEDGKPARIFTQTNKIRE